MLTDAELQRAVTTHLRDLEANFAGSLVPGEASRLLGCEMDEEAKKFLNQNPTSNGDALERFLRERFTTTSLSNAVDTVRSHIGMH